MDETFIVSVKLFDLEAGAKIRITGLSALGERPERARGVPLSTLEKVVGPMRRLRPREL